MSYAEELRLEGKQEGKQEGRQEAQVEIARRLLKRGVDNETVVATTNLSDIELTELRKSLN